MNALNIANNLFILHNQNKELNFLQMFIEPVLKEKSETEVYKDKPKNLPLINYKVLLNIEKNYVLIGKDKSGKSALLYKIYLDFLNDYSNKKIIPVFLDMKQYYNNSNITFNIVDIISNEFNISKSLITKDFNDNKIIILLDNYNDAFELTNNTIFDTNNYKNFKSVNYIMTSLSNQNYDYKILKCPIDIKKLYIHDINRRLLRELTNKWPIVEKYSKIEVIEKLTKMFSQLNIHYNFWTVSMFLCVIEKTDSVNLNNNVQLIELYIEKLLDRQSLVVDNNITSYESYKSYLAELAFHIYLNKKNDSYCVSYFELIGCCEQIKSKNIRIIAESKDIVDYLIDKGVIFKVCNDKYTFRLNGIFEYFLALYMTKNPEFTDKILKDNCLYLSFKNELEIYAGIMRNDTNLLKISFEKAKEKRKLISNTINYEEDIKIVNEDIKSLFNFSKEMQEKIKPIDLIEQDNINDLIAPIDNMESNIKIKEEINDNIISYDDYSNFLFVLGRIFRNSDDIKDIELIRNIFEFIIDEGCMSIFYVINEYIESIENDLIPLKEIKKFKQMIQSISPVISNSIIFEMIAHPTLKNIIQEEISKYEVDYKKNEYKLFVLYFLLIEINIEEEIDKVKILIDKSNSWNILNSIFVKLFLLISFKSNEKEIVQSKIKEYLEIVNKKKESKEIGKKSSKHKGESINIDQMIREINLSNLE